MKRKEPEKAGCGRTWDAGEMSVKRKWGDGRSGIEGNVVKKVSDGLDREGGGGGRG